MKRVHTTLLAILWVAVFMILSIAGVSAASADDTAKIKAQIDPLLVFKGHTYEIIKISEPVNHITAVFLNSNCRDFPNVFFFKYDPKSKEYHRIYEGLSAGIQDRPSGKLDLHTTGWGMDMQGNPGERRFESESVQKMIELGNKSGFTVIPYQDFIHMQGRNTQFYTIDKTAYYDFAVKLIGSVYKDKYPKDNCMMFDTPNLKEAQFVFAKGHYTVECKTDNNQFWTITFDGIDKDNKYLVNKKIEVQKI